MPIEVIFSLQVDDAPFTTSLRRHGPVLIQREDCDHVTKKMRKKIHKLVDEMLNVANKEIHDA